MVEGNGADGGRRVGADAGQGEQASLAVGEAAAMSFRHGARTSMQVAGARVVAEPGPGRQHVVDRRGGERRDGRPALDEAAEIVAHGGDGGLLQHDLGKPDDIRIGPRSGRGAPGEGATMAVVPAKQS